MMMRNTLSLVAGLAALFCAQEVRAQVQLKVPGMDPRLFLDQAEAGDPAAQFQLGLRLVTPREATSGEVKEGAGWIRKAAEQGHLPAMHVLGEFYEKGLGVAKDEAKAVEWQQKAADKGMPEAQLALAMLINEGKGTAKDPAKAAELALIAAKQEFGQQSVAQTFYAHKLITGDGVKKNSAKAAIWFLKAAQLGHPFAQRQLAYLYYTGDGVPLDYARCGAWYRRAAAGQGDPWAKNDLAWFLATCPEKKFHDGSLAVSIVKEAIKELQDFEENQRHEMVDTMAAALARNGQYSEAIIWQKRSLSLLAQDKEEDAKKRAELEAEFNGRLSLYKQNQPYSDTAPKAPTVPAEPLYNDDVLENKAPVSRPNPGIPEEPQPKAPKREKVI